MVLGHFATVGIAKCPKTGRLYGVRISINGKKWTATWAFPIKEDVAKREGYTSNQFPGDLLYDSKYPGCPYCKAREDLAKISRPAPKKPLKIAVSTPGFDDIGKILKSLKIQYSPIVVGLACDILFLNCGTTNYFDGTTLRNFVFNGGCVYASDHTDTMISAAFPELFNFGGHIGDACKIYADVIDSELREIIGNKIQIEFDLGVWAVLNSSKGQTLLAGSSGGKYAGLPIMVKVPFGKGVIFYTCFHNYAQASEKEKALLQLLVLKQIGSRDNKSLLETSADLGVDIDKIKAKFRSNW